MQIFAHTIWIFSFSVSNEEKNDKPEEEQTETTTTATNDDEENTLSLQDVINEQDSLEEDARAVLGGSDDRNCTYDQGYVKRQALYSCLTCIPKSATEQGGVCLACSLKCHDGHELIELYTKRNFRCDCGNSKFENFTCRLRPDKDGVNENNQYNHNYIGEYCTCNRPYPDPEDEIDDVMIQCIMCEDWYHGRHLDTTIPKEDEYSEMICQSCVDRCPFLRSYNGVNGGDPNATENGDESTLDVSGSDDKPLACRYFNMSVTFSGKGAVFFMDGWRERLCRCEKCMEMYEVHGCSFLTDTTDTVQHYEDMGKMMNESSDTCAEDSLMRLLNQQDRVVQIEMAHGYNELKAELTNFLKSFAEKRKVVEAEDVHAFFNELRARKRPRTTMPNGGACGSSSDQ